MNAAPSDLLLNSTFTFIPRSPSGQSLGFLSTVDEDAVDVHIYEVISTTRPALSINIVAGNHLWMNSSHVADSFSVTVKTTDTIDEWLTKTFSFSEREFSEDSVMFFFCQELL